MQIILDYFPYLTDQQIKHYTDLEDLYKFWNSKINVISRKDIDRIYVNHVLHSLAIAKVITFNNGTRVLDVGTGGGFPGIPLAILFPKVNFLLVDSINKKINVVNDVVSNLGLKNISTKVSRVENISEHFDFIVSRAVTNMRDFKKYVAGRFNMKNDNNLKNGILYLKGGDLEEELLGIDHKIYNISKYFKEDYFQTKKVVYIEC